MGLAYRRSLEAQGSWPQVGLTTMQKLRSGEEFNNVKSFADAYASHGRPQNTSLQLSALVLSARLFMWVGSSRLGVLDLECEQGSGGAVARRAPSQSLEFQ